MTDTADTVHCDQHGEACPTYVCGHLARHPIQRWFADVPTPDNPYPDAWCESCHAQYLSEGEDGEEGEWNERNSGCLDLAILCHRCYEDARARSVESLSEPTRAAWINAVVAAHHALVDKQRVLEADYGLSRYERWDYDQAAGTLTFSDGSVACVVADIEFIGSVSTSGGTWLWAWANFHNEPAVVGRIDAVRDWGDAQGFLHLTVPLWRGDATDGWELSGVAAEVLGAHGVYRVPTEHGFLYMALMGLQNVRAAQNPSPESAR